MRPGNYYQCICVADATAIKRIHQTVGPASQRLMAEAAQKASIHAKLQESGEYDRRAHSCSTREPV